MYYNEHSPPHFHAHYAEHKAEIGINDFALLDGYLPPKALAMVVEWAMLHQKELLDNWKRVENHEKLNSIEPLL